MSDSCPRLSRGCFQSPPNIRTLDPGFHPTHPSLHPPKPTSVTPRSMYSSSSLLSQCRDPGRQSLAPSPPPRHPSRSSDRAVAPPPPGPMLVWHNVSSSYYSTPPGSVPEPRPVSITRTGHSTAPHACVQCAQAGHAAECQNNRRTIGCCRCNAHRLGCSYLSGIYLV